MYKFDEMKNQIINTKDVMMKLHLGEELSDAEKKRVVQFYIEMSNICFINESSNDEFNNSAYGDPLI